MCVRVRVWTAMGLKLWPVFQTSSRGGRKKVATELQAW